MELDIIVYNALHEETVLIQHNISNDCVHNILDEYLNMKKFSARWMPRLLTVNKKRNLNERVFKCNPTNFLRHYCYV